VRTQTLGHQSGTRVKEEGGAVANKRKGLTIRQKKTMKRHSEHHSDKHMALMTRLMISGRSFTEAHKAAMKKVGK
tara:strand:- start:9679 stop:9903 length:225 start_codon:yes stop_codon:yes gene_type:complete